MIGFSDHQEEFVWKIVQNVVVWRLSGRSCMKNRTKWPRSANIRKILY